MKRSYFLAPQISSIKNDSLNLHMVGKNAGTYKQTIIEKNEIDKLLSKVRETKRSLFNRDPSIRLGRNSNEHTFQSNPIMIQGISKR